MNIHLDLYPVMRLRDEHKEEAIRQKAMELIVKEGFDGLSMQKLAKAAGVSPATIYIYYKNRQDLLNKLFLGVHETFSAYALKNFDPGLSLKEGLWLQWKNRLKFINAHPVYFQFFEQFRNSPCINHKDVRAAEFKENMKQFVINAVNRGEVARMEPEVFWAIAFGPFYALAKFHLSEKSMMGNTFRITDQKLKSVLAMVLNALAPKTRKR
jgi:TetR/AcrR family transcriptional regulator, multidrug resistance operon repressor